MLPGRRAQIGEQLLALPGFILSFISHTGPPKMIMIIGWRNQSRIRLISLPNDTFGSE
jgi:hypothetical protein